VRSTWPGTDSRPLVRPGIAIAVGLAAGSVPVSNIAANLLAGRDLRQVGNGTVSGTGLAAVAGVRPLFVVGIIELAKGAVGPMIAGPRHPVARALAGAGAVTAHNWSPLLRGAGGRGVSPAMGALAVSAPAGAGLLTAGLALGRLLGETALGCLIADIALVPVCSRAHGRPGKMAALAVLVPIVGKRLAGNHRPNTPLARTYLTRLLLDRDTWAPVSDFVSPHLVSSEEERI
jgi:glycerol-3-phosphate acyltransferase PlsY